MAFNIPQQGGFDEASIKDALGKQIDEGLGLNKNLDEWATSAEKDDFEAKLMQIRPNDWKEFVNTEGEIKLEDLKAKLTTKEKLSMLASHILGDQFFSIFFPGKKDNVHQLSLAEAADFFEKNPDKKVRKVSGGGKEHLVWDRTMFGQLQTLFSLADLVSGTSEEDKESFPLVPGTFWFVGIDAPQAGPKLRPTMYATLRKACEQVGIKLTFLMPGKEKGDAPAKDEIKLSFLPPSGIPLDDKGEVDYELLDWYVAAYKEAPWMLMNGSPLLAAMHMRMRGPTDDVDTVLKEALDKDHSNLGTTMGQGFSDSLKTILSKEAPPAAAPAAAKAPVVPAAAPVAAPAPEEEPGETLLDENGEPLEPIDEEAPTSPNS